jgi:hypothetical protein
MLICAALPAVAVAQTCVPPPSGIVAWWRGDGNATDSIGYNDGTLVNGAGFITGKVGKAFALNGVNQYMTVSRAGITPPATAMTEDAWFYIVAHVGPYDPIASGVPESGNGFTMEFLSGSLSFWIFLKNTYYYVTSPNAIPLKHWVHAVATYDGANLILYLNGTPVASGSVPAATIAPSDLAQIGGYPSEGRFSNARIDEVSFFNRALSAEEVAAIYGAGSAGMCVPPPQPLGGIVTGMLPIAGAGSAACKDITTGQTVSVSILPNVRSLDCEAAGLTVNPGDKVSVSLSVRGFAQ